MKMFGYTFLLLYIVPFFAHAATDYERYKPYLPYEYQIPEPHQNIYIPKYNDSSFQFISNGLLGLYFALTGMLTLFDIPVTAQDNLALAARRDMDETALKKQKLGVYVGGGAYIFLGLAMVGLSCVYIW